MNVPIKRTVLFLKELLSASYFREEGQILIEWAKSFSRLVYFWCDANIGELLNPKFPTWGTNILWYYVTQCWQSGFLSSTSVYLGLGQRAAEQSHLVLTNKPLADHEGEALREVMLICGLLLDAFVNKYVSVFTIKSQNSQKFKIYKFQNAVLFCPFKGATNAVISVNFL